MPDAANELSISISEERLELSKLPSKLQAIHDYWQKKRGGNPMPARSDIDPLDFGPMLGSVSLVEVNPKPPRFVLRVMATRLGYRRRGFRDGQDMALTRPRNYAAMFLRQFEEACALAAPTLYRNTLGFDGARYKYERLLLPLGADGCTADRLLVCAVIDEAEQNELWRRWTEADERRTSATA